MNRITAASLSLFLFACGETVNEQPDSDTDAPNIEHVFPELSEQEPEAIPDDVQATLDALPRSEVSPPIPNDDVYDLERRVDQIEFEHGQKVFE